MAHNENGRLIVTRSEWRKKHSDFKLTAKQSQDGIPKMLQWDNRYGTTLVPVVIVPDPKS